MLLSVPSRWSAPVEVVDTLPHAACQSPNCVPWYGRLPVVEVAVVVADEVEAAVAEIIGVSAEVIGGVDDPTTGVIITCGAVEDAEVVVEVVVGVVEGVGAVLHVASWIAARVMGPTTPTDGSA